MNELRLKRQLDEIAEQGIPETLDLWPAIRRRIEAVRPQRAQEAPQRTLRIAWAVVPALAAILGLALFGLATYAGAQAPFDRAAELVQPNDSGMYAVYNEGLYHKLDMSQSFGDLTFTINWAYADPVRAVIGYTTEYGPRDTFAPSAQILSVTDSNGDKLMPTGAFGDSIAPRSLTMMEAFMSPSSVAQLETLDLEVLVAVKLDALPIASPPSEGWIYDPDTDGWFFPVAEPDGFLTFNLSIPVTPARSFEGGQTSEAQGVAVTLERVVVAPSGVRADVCFDNPDPAYAWMLEGQLTDGAGSVEGWNIYDHDTWLQTMGAHPCTSLLLHRGEISLDAAQYTFRVIRMEGLPPGQGEGADLWVIGGPWAFELGVPE